MSSQDLAVVFKTTFEEEKFLRRCSFPRLQDVTYSALHSKLTGLYNTTDFRVRYIDEEGDLITIDNELDLQECFNYLLKTNKDSEKLIVKLTLSREKSQKQPKEDEEEPMVNDDGASTSNPNPSETADTRENQGETDGFGLEKAINDGLVNFQSMIQNLVTNMSTTLENDLSNLHSTLQEPIRQAVQTINTISNDIKGDNNRDNNNRDDDDDRDDKNRESNNSSLTQPSSPKSDDNVVKSNETEQITKRERIIPQDPVIHEGVFCDCCKNIICGMRWKCLTCPNYDLCQVCKSRQPIIHNHESNHEFQPIPYPKKYCCSNSTRTTANIHPAICDFCESQIFGTRHKCINCPDFDLCNDCISLAPIQHPNHTFMPIYRPGEPEIKIYDTVFHIGIVCDGCGKSIVGVRYKCTNCPNFDFCGNCEASPHNTHEDTHIFLKVKLPVSIPIPSCQPLLPNYYVRKEPNVKITDNESTEKQNESKEKEVSSINNDVDTNENSDFYQPDTKSETIVSRAPIGLYEKSSSPSSTPSIQTHKQEEVSQPYTINEIEHSNSAFSEHLTSSSQKEKKLESRFIEDVNFPDGTTLVPRAQFIKKWKVENSGNVAWPESTILKFVGGDTMFSDNSSSKNNEGFYVGLVNVGEVKEISAELQAPSEAGQRISYWRLADSEGDKFGHRLWCDILVEDDDSNMAASSMIFPVLKNEQASADKQDDVAKSIIEKFFDKEKLEKSLEVISSQSAATTNNDKEDKSNNNEKEATSEFYYDSDAESDISSLSSLENSQDYYFVEKDDHIVEDEKETVEEKIVREVVFDTDDIDDGDIDDDAGVSKKQI